MPPDRPDWSPTLAVYGDLGLENGQALSSLQRDVQNFMYNAILHAGDIAYNLYSKDGAVGDEFMNRLQTVAGFVPYMVAPGNHEQA